MKQRLSFGVLLLVAAAAAGAIAVTFLSGFLDFSALPAAETRAAVQPAAGAGGALVFDPPRPEEAPEEIRDAVTLGYDILKNTTDYLPNHVGNQLTCSNCHFDAGRERNTLSLVGVAAKYPKYRERHGYSADLVERTNGCLQRSENGQPLSPDSREMQAIMAYYHWISKGVPIYADVPWLGLQPLERENFHPSEDRGRSVFEGHCARCHGQDGQGTLIAPPLWGPGSYNDGAGMSRPPTLAAFTHQYMPKGNPYLGEEQAMEVASFVNSQPRPHFAAKDGPDDQR